MAEAARNIISFPGFVPEVIDGGVKLTKAGLPKKTHTNAKTGRSTWVNPIKSIEDVNKVIDFLQSKIDNETRLDYKKGWARNKLYFCIGIFSGFRVSDLLSLRWSDIFEADGVTYRKYVGIIEKKTGKVKELYNTIASRKYIDEYVAMWHPNTASNDYIFTNRQGKQLGRQTVDDFIKEATAAVGLEGNYSTHSVRKTFAYLYYQVLSEQYDAAIALAKLQLMLNHSSIHETLRYLGLNQEQVRDDMEVFAQAVVGGR